MRNHFPKIAFTATLALALALTFSCSSDDKDDGSGNSGGGGGSCGIVTIGTQVWQKCNLNVEPSTGKSECYDNKQANCDKYGRLYDWAAAKTACPSGWHLPSNTEWDALVTAVGGTSTAGTKLKAKSGWNEGGNGQDTYGFAALPGGYGKSDDNFYNVGSNGRWWSATENSANYAYFMDIYDDEDVERDYDIKDYLYSVRCVQD